MALHPMNPKNPTNQTNETNARTVLVAVNDIFFYTKLRDALLPRGYHLDRARRQEQVLELGSASNLACVIVNMNDPALDGMQALQDIRQHLPPTLPVLAFANHEEVETWQRAKALGVTKIVSRNEFSSRTRELVEEMMEGTRQ